MQKKKLPTFDAALVSGGGTRRNLMRRVIARDGRRCCLLMALHAHRHAPAHRALLAGNLVSGNSRGASNTVAATVS